MTRFLQIAALLAILFPLTSAADAKGLSKKSGGTLVSHDNIHKSGGTLVSHDNLHLHKGGIENHGPSRTYPRDHRWSSRYWDSRFRCEFCYSEFDRCYFYFYAPAGCFYPVSCIEQYPPTPVTAPAPVTPAPVTVAPVVPPATVVQVNQNTNVNR